MNLPAVQRGTVVIVAMLIVALAATAASFALQHQDLALRQLEVSRDYEQARWILRGGAHWARAILAEDARSSETDHSRELWASGLPSTQVEQGALAGEIRDQQALFNLANLQRDGKPSERDVAAFRRLLASLQLKAELADRITAAQPMSELQELKRVPGCDERVVARLREFVTVLPQRTPVNVNTAMPELLAALVEGLSLAEALVLAQGAKAQPLRETAEFRARLPRPELSANVEDVAVRSRFFLVEGRALLGTASVRLQALLQREGKALPVVLWLRTS
jgi:general secretion pathway protein K